MNKSFDPTTKSNTMLNSCNRWESFNSRKQGVLLLKAPMRRLSMSLHGDDDVDDETTLSPCTDDSYTANSQCQFNDSYEIRKFLEMNDSDEEGDGDDDKSTDAFMFLPQFPVPENKHLRRRIRFAPSVMQREYALTFGDNTSCHGPCPLSLDWKHTASKKVAYNDAVTGDTSASCRSVRFLSTKQRRERLLRFVSDSIEKLHRLEFELSKASPEHEEEEKQLSPTGRRTAWPKKRLNQPSTARQGSLTSLPTDTSGW
jgi:hypothetical protein